jgi:hypothetical protein
VSGGWTTPGETPADGSEPPPPTGPGWSTTQPGSGWGGYPAAPTPPRPGVVPLRPLAVGEVLDGAFTTIRRYPTATLGLAAAVMIGVTATQVVASYFLLDGVSNLSTDGTTSGDFLSRSISVDLIVFVVTLVATLVLSGMITAVIGQAVLGRPMRAGEAWQAMRARLGALVGVTLVIIGVSLAITAVGVAPGIVLFAVGATGAGVALGVIGFLAAALVVIWLVVTLEFATPVVVLEKQGVRASLRRSRALVAGSWWRVFGIIAVASVLAQIVAGVITLPFSLAAGFSTIVDGGRGTPLDFVSLLLIGAGGFIAGTIVLPFTAGVVALVYIDRRMRAEALDLTLQQAASGERR